MEPYLYYFKEAGHGFQTGTNTLKVFLLEFTQTH